MRLGRPILFKEGFVTLTTRRILFCCIVAILISGCSRQPTNASAAGEPPAFPVKVMTAQPQVVPEATEYLATLKSRNAAALQPQVEGEIVKILVHSGEKVDAGAPILEIDPKKQEATVGTQEATYKSKLAVEQYDLADLQRKKQLFAAGVIAKADLDASQAAYDAAKADAESLVASIREQKEQLHYYRVTAPTAGIVGDIPVHVGDRVAVTTLLTTLDRGGDIEAYIYVPAEKASAVRMNMPMEILDDAGKPVLHSTVFFISPQVDTSSQTLLLKARVPNPGHRFNNDQTVHARLIWSERKAPLIPLTAYRGSAARCSLL
jgi:RND family efflux transporter MFP subunit